MVFSYISKYPGIPGSCLWIHKLVCVREALQAHTCLIFSIGMLECPPVHLTPKSKYYQCILVKIQSPKFSECLQDNSWTIQELAALETAYRQKSKRVISAVTSDNIPAIYGRFRGKAVSLLSPFRNKRTGPRKLKTCSKYWIKCILGLAPNYSCPTFLRIMNTQGRSIGIPCPSESLHQYHQWKILKNWTPKLLFVI